MSKDLPPVSLDDHLCFALYSATIEINRAYKPLLDALGITYPQYLVLSVLLEGDGQNIKAISERLGLEQSTITPLMKRLEQAGFVERRRNPQDERQVQVFLTPRGKEVPEVRRCLAETLMEKSGMTPERLSQLNREVRQLLGGLRGG